jgi:radical SAM protein with 4Fe4S-binding SPASM domain
MDKDILTVDNHVDGIYLYMKLLKKDPQKAKEVLKQLEWNGGGTYSSGVGFGDIDFLGNVHADQFWMYYSFGNVRERKFSEIWMDTSDKLMAGLKSRPTHIKGKCSLCKWFKACGGSLRVRADLVYDDPFAPDPGCYLTDEEIGLTAEDWKILEEKGELFPVPEALTAVS